MSYFDLTVFNRIAAQQKETNDLLKQLIELMKAQRQQSLTLPRFGETYQPSINPIHLYTTTCAADTSAGTNASLMEPQAQWPFPTSPKP